MITPDKVVRTTCPYCGVGCQMDLNIKDGAIYAVAAPFDAAPNYGMLCVKGQFGTEQSRSNPTCLSWLRSTTFMRRLTGWFVKAVLDFRQCKYAMAQQWGRIFWRYWLKL